MLINDLTTEKFLESLRAADPVFKYAVASEEASAYIEIPWVISGAFVADNPDSENVEKVITGLIAAQSSIDLLTLWNDGDIASEDNLLKAMDGVTKRGIPFRDSRLLINNVTYHEHREPGAPEAIDLDYVCCIKLQVGIEE